MLITDYVEIILPSIVHVACQAETLKKKRNSIN